MALRLIGNGPEIRRLRLLSGRNQRRLADEAQVSPSVLCRIEYGIRGDTPEVLARLADVLGVEILDIARLVDTDAGQACEAAPAHTAGAASSPAYPPYETQKGV